MGKRLLPFRQYNEHEVINMFALDDSVLTATQSITETHSGDAGVFVKVSAGDLDADPVTYTSDSYLGKTDFPYVGANGYPKVSLKVTPAASGDRFPLGITLFETAKYDENGEKLLYYPQKAMDHQVLLPGQAVPIATRGVFTLSSAAIDGSLTVGSSFKLSANAGKITGAGLNDAVALGTVLAKGTRGDNGISYKLKDGSTQGDAFSGSYAIIKLGF
jgi:hypothetical protein